MAVAFPFSAMVGQDEMKLAILIAAIDPSIGGVLVFGDRGTGKSTAVRALGRAAAAHARGGGLSAISAMPPRPGAATTARRRPRAAVAKTHLVPVPVVDLPLGATEDRVVGALDLERALAQGVKAFEPGLLARANRGFLYIDEVNLLEDHLVDLLIDVAASGENVVEREGLSVRHPARFVLVGSGNPEEGELRPQLLDRFGLSRRGAHADRPRHPRRGRAAPRRLRARPRRLRRAVEEGRRRGAPAHRRRTRAPAAGRGARRGARARGAACAWRSAPTACAAN